MLRRAIVLSKFRKIPEAINRWFNNRHYSA